MFKWMDVCINFLRPILSSVEACFVWIKCFDMKIYFLWLDRFMALECLIHLLLYFILQTKCKNRIQKHYFLFAFNQKSHGSTAVGMENLIVDSDSIYLFWLIVDSILFGFPFHLITYKANEIFDKNATTVLQELSILRAIHR